jgi:NitT/TauT family transport system permease protein
MEQKPQWFAIRSPLEQRRATMVRVGAFIVPLVIWCLVSYVPFIWHPYMQLTDTGDSMILTNDQPWPIKIVEEENARLKADNEKPAVGYRVNPVFLPAPHKVFFAFFSAFFQAPSEGEPWLHEALWHSITIIFWGFTLSAVVGVPLGILCGTFDFFSKLIEPFVDFIRYMPAPAFGALCVAILSIDDAPKIAIIWIGTFFQMVLVVANTTRLLDVGLLEAAQTLGAKKTQLLARVILPGIMPNLFNDMRILVGWAWTYLIVAELIGASSGISHFINLQGRHFHFDNVFAAIIMIGLIGLFCDQILAALGTYIFPYVPGNRVNPIVGAILGAILFAPQRIILARSNARHRRRAEAQAAAAQLKPAVVDAKSATASNTVSPAGIVPDVNLT